MFHNAEIATLQKDCLITIKFSKEEDYLKRWNNTSKTTTSQWVNSIVGHKEMRQTWLTIVLTTLCQHLLLEAKDGKK